MVDGQTVPRDANVLQGRLLRTIKNAETETPKCKSRFVAGGHRDREKEELFDPQLDYGEACFSSHHCANRSSERMENMD